jgi:hypothetical protein
MVGLSVLAFVAVAFAVYYVKSTAQVFITNSASMACAKEAKDHPSDRLAMDRCLKARGVLVEDSPPPGYRAPSATHSPPPPPSDPYATCLRAPNVIKYAPKSSAWATELSSCMQRAGETAVVTMQRNPSTGAIEYGVLR